MKKKTTKTATEAIHYKITRRDEIEMRIRLEVWGIVKKIAEEAMAVLDEYLPPSSQGKGE